LFCEEEKNSRKFTCLGTPTPDGYRKYCLVESWCVGLSTVVHEEWSGEQEGVLGSLLELEDEPADIEEEG
jgi:hypothetical protein